MNQTASITIVIDTVTDVLMQRQAQGLSITEWTVERVLRDEVGWERAGELLDRILIEPIIRETIEVDKLDFSEPNDSVGNYWCDRP
ncbi:hypothetical protein, partial [Aneurinibacillus aneurinilyticus]|uniref:hypothetical protein n=1 Tax=Aneurinibacillus aneurinilyticus TaxID=1391 RepID=UPI00366FB55A